MIPDRLEREIYIEAPPELVWSIVTEPEHVAGWFSETVEMDVREGGEASFTWPGQGPARARIERLDPPRLFAFRWMRDVRSPPRGRELDPTNSTLVEIALTPEGDGTRLTVTESGFRALAGGGDDIASYAEDNRDGWRRETEDLRAYVLGVVGAATSP